MPLPLYSVNSISDYSVAYVYTFKFKIFSYFSLFSLSMKTWRQICPPDQSYLLLVTYVGISCCTKSFVNLTFRSLSWLFPRLFTYIWCCQRLNNLPAVHQVVLMPKIPVGRNCYSGRFSLIIGYGSIPCT